MSYPNPFEKMVNISLPDQVRAFIEAQAQSKGIGSLNEYVYQLILQEQDRIIQQQRLETLLVEGLESGEPIEATSEWWNQKREKLADRLLTED
ncbi:MAG: type II toxin-antitoxin system ParD family antitoxin [Cyanobacteria bacterium P01_F01_bin.42]